MSEAIAQNTTEPRAAEVGEDLAAHASGWFRSVKARTSLMSRLLLAETKLAAISVAGMAFFGVMAAAFALGAWGLALAGLVHGLLAVNVSLWIILLSLALLHVIAAMCMWVFAMRLTRHLEFSATRQQLMKSVEVEES